MSPRPGLTQPLSSEWPPGRAALVSGGIITPFQGLLPDQPSLKMSSGGPAVVTCRSMRWSHAGAPHAVVTCRSTIPCSLCVSCPCLSHQVRKKASPHLPRFLWLRLVSPAPFLCAVVLSEGCSLGNHYRWSYLLWNLATLSILRKHLFLTIRDWSLGSRATGPLKTGVSSQDQLLQPADWENLMDACNSSLNCRTEISDTP